jgi:DNA-directed RNA polymerase subunit beta'
VAVGAPLTEGEVSACDLLEVAGPEAAGEYLLAQVGRIYRRHGLEIDDRHFEVILARLLGHVLVTDPGDTGLLPGQVLQAGAFRERNESLAKGLRRAVGRHHLQGLTRVAGGAEGFLAAASFQRAVSVLAAAALAGSSDLVAGLKENVMLGRLIPAGTGSPRLREARVVVRGKEEGDAEG